MNTNLCSCRRMTQPGILQGKILASNIPRPSILLFSDGYRVRKRRVRRKHARAWPTCSLETTNAANTKRCRVWSWPGKRDPRGKPLFTKNERERGVLLPRETPILASLIDARVNLSLRRLPSGYLRIEGRYFRLEGILERFRANIPRRGAIMRDRFPFGNRGLVFWGNLSRRYLGIDKIDEVCVCVCVWGNSSKWRGIIRPRVWTRMFTECWWWERIWMENKMYWELEFLCALFFWFILYDHVIYNDNFINKLFFIFNSLEISVIKQMSIFTVFKKNKFINSIRDGRADSKKCVIKIK